jgi:hypothetical protein
MWVISESPGIPHVSMDSREGWVGVSSVYTPNPAEELDAQTVTLTISQTYCVFDLK